MAFLNTLLYQEVNNLFRDFIAKILQIFNIYNGIITLIAVNYPQSHYFIVTLQKRSVLNTTEML